MATRVLLLMPTFIHVGRFVLVLEVHVDLEEGVPDRTFNSCIGVIRASRIIFLGLINHDRGDITKVVRDLGIDMNPILIIIGNHLPIVSLAMIAETGMPLTVG